MEEGKKVVSNLVFSGVGFIVSIAVGLLLPRFFALTYGSEVNGLLNSANQFVIYLNLFEAGVGAATLQALYGPFSTDAREDISSIMKATGEYYRKAGLYYLIGLVVLCLVYPIIVSSELGFLKISGVIFFIGIPNVLNFWLQGKYCIMMEAEGKKYIRTNLTTIVKLSTSILKIVLIRLHVDVIIVLALSALITIASMLYVVLYVRRHYRWLDRSAKANYDAISEKNFALVHEVSGLIFGNTDLIILSIFCGLKVVSVYSMYKIVVTQLSNLITIFPDSFTFSLGQTYQSDRKLFMKRLDIVESGHSIIFHSICGVTLFLFIPFMKLYTTGLTDIDYVDYRLALLFVAADLLTYSRTMSIITINRFAGHFKFTTSRTIAESAINLTTSLIAVQFIGIYGVLLGTVFALMYRTNDCIFYCNHRLLDRSVLKTYSIHLSNLAIMVLLQFFFPLVFRNIDSYLSFIVSGAVCILISGALMLLLQVILYPDFRDAVSGIIRRVP